MNLQIRPLSAQWDDYELLDSGGRLKLERFGDCVVIRSEPKAWWNPRRPDLWKSAHARYFDDDKKSAHWEFFKKIRPPQMRFGKTVFLTKFMEGSKHLGVHRRAGGTLSLQTRKRGAQADFAQSLRIHWGCDARRGGGGV